MELKESHRDLTSTSKNRIGETTTDPASFSFGIIDLDTTESNYNLPGTIPTDIMKNYKYIGKGSFNSEHYNNRPKIEDTTSLSFSNVSFVLNDIATNGDKHQTVLNPPSSYNVDTRAKSSFTTTTTTNTSADYFQNDPNSTHNFISNYSEADTPSPIHNNTMNITNFDNIDIINNTLNSSTIGPSTPFIHDSILSQQTTSSPLDNYSSNYDFNYKGWRENVNITINESVVYTNDSILFIPQFNYDGSSSFMNGIAKIDSSPETIAKVFILAVVSIFGSIGNFLVVGSVIKNRHFHRPPFYFLLSMGITDLARAGFCLPVVMATALQGSIWRHGDTACKLFAFAASFFVFSSTLSLLVISVERHLSIVHSKAYRRRCHGFINLFATMFIWVTTFIISFPPIFASMGAGEYVFISEEAQCTYSHKHFSKNDGLNSVLTFIGITSLTLFLYYRIFVFMRSHRRMRPLQHRPAFSSTWTFVGPGANGQAFINWLNGFGGNASNVYQRPAAAVASTVTGSGPNTNPNSDQLDHSRCTQRLNIGRVVNLCTTKNEHLTRLFFIMTLVHGATWLPYVILSLWRVFVNSSSIPAGFITYAAWLSYSQVAICPLTYFLSRGRSRNASRVIQMEPTERNDFLLESKIFK